MLLAKVCLSVLSGWELLQHSVFDLFFQSKFRPGIFFNFTVAMQRTAFLLFGWIGLLLLPFSCKFNDPIDPNQPVPEHPATALGLGQFELHPDTLANLVTLEAPATFTRRMVGLRAVANPLQFTVLYTNPDSSATVEIAYQNRKKKGAVNETGLEETRTNFIYLINTYRSAELKTDDYREINGQRFLVLEAVLDWEGYRQVTTRYATVKNGKLFIVSMHYPLREFESTQTQREALLHSIRFL